MSRLRAPSRIALGTSLLIVTCCQTPQPAPPTPAPAPPPITRPAPAPTPIAPEASWIDRPQTAGDWRYVAEPSETLALFGPPGSPKLVIGCELKTRSIGIVRPISGARQGDIAMRIRTETTSRALTAKPTSGSSPRAVVTLDARDPLLDAMAITRGRFAVEVEGEPGLYVPAWAEVTRVIEDCR